MRMLRLKKAIGSKTGIWVGEKNKIKATLIKGSKQGTCKYYCSGYTVQDGFLKLGLAYIDLSKGLRNSSSIRTK